MQVVIPVCFTLVYKGCGIKPVIYRAILQETDIDGAEVAAGMGFAGL